MQLFVLLYVYAYVADGVRDHGYHSRLTLLHKYMKSASTNCSVTFGQPYTWVEYALISFFFSFLGNDNRKGKVFITTNWFVIVVSYQNVEVKKTAVWIRNPYKEG
jgi:hypothetical protein